MNRRPLLALSLTATRSPLRGSLLFAANLRTAKNTATPAAPAAAAPVHHREWRHRHRSHQDLRPQERARHHGSFHRFSMSRPASSSSPPPISGSLRITSTPARSISFTATFLCPCTPIPASLPTIPVPPLTSASVKRSNKSCSRTRSSGKPMVT